MPTLENNDNEDDVWRRLLAILALTLDIKATEKMKLTTISLSGQNVSITENQLPVRSSHYYGLEALSLGKVGCEPFLLQRQNGYSRVDGRAEMSRLWRTKEVLA